MLFRFPVTYLVPDYPTGQVGNCLWALCLLEAVQRRIEIILISSWNSMKANY